MKIEIRSASDYRYDGTSVNPSALLVRGTNGSNIGVAFYTETEFVAFGVHDDQEGFCVLEGKGTANFDGELVRVGVGDSFLLPPGVSHGFIRDADSVPLKLLWFHAAP